VDDGPKYQPMPPLTDDEYAALKEDIRVNGLMYAIQVDENGNIIDGHHRKQICEELGIPARYEQRAGMSEDDKWDMALRLNNNRRHLSNEQKRTLVRSELIRNPNRSDAKIAGLIGVSGMMVNRHRREMAAEAKQEADEANWPPKYRAAVERMVELMKQQVQGWITISNGIVEIFTNYPDFVDEYVEETGLDEYEMSVMLHEMEGTNWDKYPGLQKAYKQLMPYRQRLTKGITFTHETGWSDHPTPFRLEEDESDGG